MTATEQMHKARTEPNKEDNDSNIANINLNDNNNEQQQQQNLTTLESQDVIQNIEATKKSAKRSKNQRDTAVNFYTTRKKQ
jgi:hypothetical protein